MSHFLIESAMREWDHGSFALDLDRMYFSYEACVLMRQKIAKHDKKKVYKQPVLIRYGSLVMNTAGSSGTKGDAGTKRM